MIMFEMAEMWIFDLALKPHLKLLLVYLIKRESHFNNGLIYFDEIDSIMKVNNTLIPRH